MYRKILYSLFLLAMVMNLPAQTPDHYPPTVPKEVDVTLFNLVLYVVLPIAVVAVFFWYQRSMKKKQRRNLEEEKKQKDRNSGRNL